MTPHLKLCFRKNRKQFNFAVTPDTGATRTIIAKNILDRHAVTFSKTDEKLFNASGSRMACEGSVKFRVSHVDFSGPTSTVHALISSDLRDEILLSWHDMMSLGILSPNFPAPVVAAVSSSGPARAASSASSKPDTLAAVQQDFRDVFSDDLAALKNKCLGGAPMKIHLREDVSIVPIKAKVCRPVPVHLRADADKVIDDLLQAEVIFPVTVPTEWTSFGHFVPKPTGGVRLVTDYVQLNKFVNRPVHPFPSSMDIIQSIDASSRYFIVMDCKFGYFQVPLDQESALLTTFLVPQGRFAYRRAPMGLNASGDEFCYRSDVAIRGIPGVSKLVDDILVQAPDEQVALHRFRLVLDRCRKNGMTISFKKLQFGTSVKFAGHLVTADGTRPDPEKIQAIARFPAPKDVSSLRSYLGLVNQLASFLPDLAHATSNMRQLLKKDVPFIWSDDINKEFEDSRELLTSEKILKPFDPSLTTELLTDASRLHGLGYILLQRSSDSTPRLIKCGSCSLTPAQTRYATVELELLAVQWAVRKCDYYLRGLRQFTVVTDHRPLIGTMAKSLHEITNPRLRRLREKLAGYGCMM